MGMTLDRVLMFTLSLSLGVIIQGEGDLVVGAVLFAEAGPAFHKELLNSSNG